MQAQGIKFKATVSCSLIPHWTVYLSAFSLSFTFYFPYMRTMRHTFLLDKIKTGLPYSKWLPWMVSLVLHLPACILSITLHMSDGTIGTAATDSSDVCQRCELWFGPGSWVTSEDNVMSSCSLMLCYWSLSVDLAKEEAAELLKDRACIFVRMLLVTQMALKVWHYKN